MATKRTKTFVVSDIDSLDRVDSWWAGLLRTGPKEITDIEWTSNGDLIWNLKLTWAKLDFNSPPFKVCMPAYASFSLEDLTDILELSIQQRNQVKANLSLFKKKLDDWEVIELSNSDYHDMLDSDQTSDEELSMGVDPSLSYASKLDMVEKIMVSEFLWPYYKSIARTYLMLEAKISEVQKEIEQREDTSFTIVRVDRGMLRETFTKQIGYDNKWLFASDDEIFEDYYESDDPEES